MALNGNRFKIYPGRKPCPACHGYPQLVVVNNRHVPQCDRCAGRGTVDSKDEVGDADVSADIPH